MPSPATALAAGDGLEHQAYCLAADGKINPQGIGESQPTRQRPLLGKSPLSRLGLPQLHPSALTHPLLARDTSSLAVLSMKIARPLDLLEVTK